MDLAPAHRAHRAPQAGVKAEKKKKIDRKKRGIERDPNHQNKKVLK